MKFAKTIILIFISINGLSQQIDTILFDKNWKMVDSENYKFIRTYEITDTLYQIIDYYKNGKKYSAGFCSLDSDLTYKNILNMSGPCYWYDKKGRIEIMAIYNPFNYPQLLNKIITSKPNLETKIKSELTLWIYYFKNGNISSFGFLLNDCNRHGEWTSFTKKGDKLSEKNYSHNILNGKYKLYRSNGSQSLERNYKNGKKHGKEIMIDNNGNIFFETNYKDGKKHGKEIWYNPDNEIKSTTKFENGKKISDKL